MTRKQTLQYAKVAGYHNDTKRFTRLLIEGRVNRADMNEAWLNGQRAKQNKVSCSCSDCKKESELSQNNR